MWNVNRLKVIGAIAVMMWANGAGAQQTSSASPRQVELAHRYIVAAHMDRTLDGTMRAMANLPADAKITTEQRQALVEVVTDVTVGMVGKMKARMEPIIAEIYSEAELEAMVTFYESPVGQSMIAKTPEMAARMAPVMQEIMPEMQKEMRAKLCAKIDCSAG